MRALVKYFLNLKTLILQQKILKHSSVKVGAACPEKFVFNILQFGLLDEWEYLYKLSFSSEHCIHLWQEVGLKADIG